MASLEMPTVMIIGPLGIGKSSLAIMALGLKALWICTERGALAPALDPKINKMAPQLPPHVECLSLRAPCDEVMKVVKTVAIPAFKAGKIGAVVIDTISELCDREYHVGHVVKGIGTEYGKASAYVADKFRPIIWTLMEAGMIIIAIAHERPPTDIQGNVKKGGPRLPGRLSDILPGEFSIVLRCAVEPSPVPGEDARRVFLCNPLDQDWPMKDRYGVVEDGMPMDLKLVLQRAVKRARGEY